MLLRISSVLNNNFFSKHSFLCLMQLMGTQKKKQAPTYFPISKSFHIQRILRRNIAVNCQRSRVESLLLNPHLENQINTFCTSLDLCLKKFCLTIRICLIMFITINSTSVSYYRFVSLKMLTCWKCELYTTSP